MYATKPSFRGHHHAQSLIDPLSNTRPWAERCGAEAKSGAAVLYDIVNIQDKEITADTSYTAQDRRSNASTALNNSISQPEPIVNTSEKENIIKHDIDETRYSIATKKKVMAKLKENKTREERRAEKRVGWVYF